MRYREMDDTSKRSVTKFRVYAPTFAQNDAKQRENAERSLFAYSMAMLDAN